MMRSKNNIIVAIALFTVKCAVANVVTNSFIIAQGNGVSVSQDGSIIHDKRANDDITVRARSGWLVNGRDSVSLSASRGGMLKVMSRLGEDEEHVHVYPSETKDVHSSDIILGVLPKSDNLIAMYALPDTSTVVSISAMHEVTKRGKHKETTTYYPCVCGETHNPQEVVRIYEVEPDGYEWTASGAGQTVKASTWTDQMSKGLRQSIEFTVVGKRDDCASCMCTASTNVVVDVHELSVTNDLYLGLDRTDFGRTNPVFKVAGALIDPEPTGSSAYLWTYCGICAFTGRTDRAQVRYFAPDPDNASISYLAEPLTVHGTATNAEGLSASANCTTNFTVVKVDVTIGGVGEEKEEKEGAFIQYVADAANGQWTEEGTNAIVAVSITCEPENLPADEMITISAPEKSLYIRHNGKYYVIPDETSFPAYLLRDVEFVLHGHDESSGFCDREIKVEHERSGAVDVAKYTAVRVDLKVKDLWGNVDDDIEYSQGAYVHWNIDNDDANDNALGGLKHPGGDYLQIGTGQIAKEDDLRQLTMSVSPCPFDGEVVLRIGNDKAKVWKSNMKGSANLVVDAGGEKRWNLADSSQRQDFVALCSCLWVEGVRNGESRITLSYEAPLGGNDCSDTVKYTFISANCGRQPRTDITERSIIEGRFPGLVRCEWSITGGPSKYYNCLAWAVGKTDVWVNDVVKIDGVSLSEIVRGGVTYWGIDKKYGNGDGIRDIADIDSFFLAEANVVPTTSVKDATIIYYDGYHAARRMICDCGSGCWQVFESKCGKLHRIEHVYDQLSDRYGVPARYYRPR